jgi:deoxyribonuclease V
MKIINLHPWDVIPAEAVSIQNELAGKVRGGSLASLNTVLGLDVSYHRATAAFRASAALLSYPGLEVVQTWFHEGRSGFPYVPGLLSFREIPPLIPLLEQVPAPELIMVDGQGIAHPRGLGLACHVGLITGIPTIGCAKSRLCGEFEEPGSEPGSHSDLVLDGMPIGAVLRSKKGCKPLFISPGHLLDVDAALEGVKACLKGYRLPEPVRIADKLSKSPAEGPRG